MLEPPDNRAASYRLVPLIDTDMVMVLNECSEESSYRTWNEYIYKYIYIYLKKNTQGKPLPKMINASKFKGCFFIPPVVVADEKSRYLNYLVHFLIHSCVQQGACNSQWFHLSLLCYLLCTCTWYRAALCRPPLSAPLMELQRDKEGVEDAGGSPTDWFKTFRSWKRIFSQDQNKN